MRYILICVRLIFVSSCADVAGSSLPSITLTSSKMWRSNMTNLESAHGRIMDADIALESTRFARHNVLVQASAAMTAQANQLTNIALQILG